MTPHSIVEDMEKLEKLLGPNLDKVLKTEAWPDLKETLRNNAVHFEFGKAAPEDQHLEFAHDLMDRGLFQLPYSAVLMTGNASPKSAVLAIADRNDKAHPLTVIVFAPVMVGNSMVAEAAPLYVLTVDQEPGDQARVRWSSLATGQYKSRKTGEDKDGEDMEQSTRAALQLAMGWPILLMSKDVEAVRLEAPERLNRARVARGKIPIRERFVVRIRPEARERQRQAAEGFRSSPKMHWRRGHFRRVSETLVVPVAPTIVNAEPGSRPLAKQYKLG
jgi:hypothetical protein